MNFNQYFYYDILIIILFLFFPLKNYNNQKFILIKKINFLYSKINKSL